MKLLTLVLAILSLSTFAQTGGQEELSEILNLEINPAHSLQRIYELPRNAWLKLPTSLTYGSSVSDVKIVSIYYNLMPDDQYEFFCTYRSQAQSSTMDFISCQNSEGFQIISNVSDLDDMRFPMDKSSSIKMKLIATSGPLEKVHATFVVDWK